MPSLRSSVHDFLRTHGLPLHRSLGQHFLVEEAILWAIIEAANVRLGERVMEIGPGIGILTRELLKTDARVEAIELDARFPSLLRVFIAEDRDAAHRIDHLTITHGDALRVPLPSEPWSVVANIPYQITSPLLARFLLRADPPPTSLTLLIQREVAEKILGRDGANRLSLLVSAFGDATIVRHVAPGCFLPPPKVESSILHVTRTATPLLSPQELTCLIDLSRIAFGGKRKMLRSTVGKLPGGMDLLEHNRIDPLLRPEALPRDAWFSLARSMQSQNATHGEGKPNA